MTDPRVQALCDELGIKIVDRHRYPEPGEARAVETLARIIRRHGEGHLRLVLSTLAETDNNKGQLDEVLFWAASDMVRACPEILKRRAGDWLTMWDVCPLGELQFIAQDLRGVVPLIFAFVGMLYERVVKAFGPRASSRICSMTAGEIRHE
ncbi:hypothetical protein [Mesorhizobium sp.]|uniref:hypothetical protein n=1 Tax=Mesorhizobium sp. TaxID=1871066 RepID=UPI00257DBA66|nr:hypothetical protein [Mesorhizobium sp.]